MGFISKNNKVLLSAFLTQKGRENMINGSLEDFQIKYYGMSDPDVNYLIEGNLESGKIPDLSGGYEGAVKSIASGVEQRYTIEGGANIVNDIAGFNLHVKAVEGNSSFQKTLVSIPDVTIPVENMEIILTDLNNSADTYGNLASSFNFPITETQRKAFYNEYKNTALAEMAVMKQFIVVSVAKESYGEMIDGKTIELQIPIKGGKTMTIHSSFYGFNENLNTQLSESNGFGSEFGCTPTAGNGYSSNIAFLFSNDIAKPNDKIVKTTLSNPELTLSSYGSSGVTVDMSPESLYELNLETLGTSIQVVVKVSGSDVTVPLMNAVEMKSSSVFRPLFPIQGLIFLNTSSTTKVIKPELATITASSTKVWSKWSSDNKFPSDKGGYGKVTASFSDEQYGLCVDKPVGIAYLDKGLIVLTHPDIIGQYDILSTTGYSLSFKSVVTEFSQTITCVALPDEFYQSNNPTFSEAYPEGLSNTDYVYITEIGLYNKFGDLIAIAKTSEPVKKNKLNVALFSVKLKL